MSDLVIIDWLFCLKANQGLLSQIGMALEWDSTMIFPYGQEIRDETDKVAFQFARNHTMSHQYATFKLGNLV